MERQKFEESFKDAFQKAEVVPTDNVWTNIELDLERLQSGKMKQRVVFYKLVAAASVIFALAMGGVGYYIFSTDGSHSNQYANNQNAIDDSKITKPNEEGASLDGMDKDIAANSKPFISSPNENQNQSISTLDKNTPTDKANDLANPNRNESNTSRELVSKNIMDGSKDASNIPFDPNPQQTALPLSENNVSVEDPSDIKTSGIAFTNRSLPALVRPRKFELYFPKTEPDKFDILLAQEMWAEKQKKQSNYEKVWTSVGFSAGSFNPPTAKSNMGTMSGASGFVQNYSVNNTLANEAGASGVAYAFGVNVGGRISNRWTLQGGVNYLTQNSNYTSDAVITTDYQNYTLANSAEFSKMADASSTARVVNTSPYNINNSLQFISVPLQAGYLIVNNAFGLQVNGGVSTDLFLQNTFTPENGTLNKVTNGSGSDSPYRPVNFSGLIGTELSYRFADRYRLSINPGIRYPFNSIYKSDLGLESSPMTFDVGLRFRYIFQ